MKICGKRLTALLLALCITLGLAACGSSGGDDTGSGAETISGTVYVPKFVDLDLKADYISGGCCDGTNVYIVAQTSKEEEVTDPDSGETYTNYSYQEGIYRVNMETGETSELENYEPSYTFDNYDEGWFSLGGIRAGADGTLWVTERANIYTFDLPEGFNEETDDRWQYQTNTRVELLRQLDATGKELQVLDITGIQEKLNGWDYIDSDLTMDEEGCLYVYGTNENGAWSVAVLDKDCNVLFTLEDDWGEFVTLNDGTVARKRRVDNGYVVTRVDKAAKGWSSTEYPLPYAANNIYDGAGDYLFYYNSGESLYGYKEGAEEGEKLLTWSAADINMDRLVFFTFLPDGRIAAMTQDWEYNSSDSSSSQVTELALLTETEASAVTEKTVLTYATMGLGSDMRSSIIKFNKTNDKYRIEIQDYSEYSTEEDYYAGLTKLNTEILAGKVPDILAVDNLPLRQYEAKGLLEDLWPFIDSDPDISRDDLMLRVFEAAEKDGKLYQAVEGFSISTVIGSRKVVGDEMGWNLEELKAALATMPEGCSIFGESDTKDNMLRYILAMNVDGYVDWETGECKFESDQFKAALEFCNSFPLEYDPNAERESEPARVAAGRQMLMTVSLTDFGDLQMHEAIFAGEEGLKVYNMEYNYGGSGTSVVIGSSSTSAGYMGSEADVSKRLIPGRYITFKGFPMEDGSCGSTFTLTTSMAMSSTCKDKEGAWSFIRELLLPKAERKYYTNSYGWGFPSNKADFDALVKDAMTPEYITDGEGKQVLGPDGEPVEQSKGGWGWDTLNIDIVATSQEEYDQVMELYNAITSVSSYDSSIYDIVSDLAGSYFNGDKSLDETCSLIQGRVKLYVDENR